jgi:hypothetical protein
VPGGDYEVAASAGDTGQYAGYRVLDWSSALSEVCDPERCWVMLCRRIRDAATQDRRGDSLVVAVGASTEC